MFNFIIIFSWINLFAVFTLRTHIIINAYFFFLLFLTNYFIFFIYNFKCIISFIFFIIFVFLFLMFWNMFLTFVSCIIISNFSHRKAVVKAMFLIQKSLNFNIFLLFSKIILKIINLLNFLIFTIFLRIVNVFLIFNLHVKIIISITFILCIYFISYLFLIYVINFIFLFDFRFKKTLISRKKSVKIAIIDYLIVVFIQIFLSIVFFVFSITFFNFLITFFNFIIYFSKYSFVVFVTFKHSWYVACFIILKNFIIIVHDVIFDKFFSFNL